jgi:hypothetical protein
MSGERHPGCLEYEDPTNRRGDGNPLHPAVLRVIRFDAGMYFGIWKIPVWATRLREVDLVRAERLL